MWEVKEVSTIMLKYLASLKRPLDVNEVLKCLQDLLYIRLAHFAFLYPCICALTKCTPYVPFPC
jgi:hypothetical protein